MKVARGKILVKFKKTTKNNVIATLNTSKGCSLEKKIKNTSVHRLKIPGNKSIEEMIEEYRINPDVEFVEPDYLLEAFQVIPDDTFFAQQWGIDSISDIDIDAPEAWGIERGTSSILIAIVDTGVYSDHEDLNNKVITGYDFVNDDNNPDDDHGHGTHVAGIASAETNNGIGVAGVCWDSLILPVKALDSDGNGYTSDVAGGIMWAADNGANIINLSLGGDFSYTLEGAVDYAYYDKGCVLIAAMGNDDANITQYPAAFDNVIAVGAIDAFNSRCSTNTWGSNYGSHIDVVAPGDNILNCYPNPLYSYLSGTSMATPFVAGMAALLLSYKPLMPQESIMDTIRYTADDIINGEATSGFDIYTGHGRINAYSALLIHSSPNYSIINTMCEVQTNPTDVNDSTPEFSWTFSHEYSFVNQYAYHIIVSANLSNINANIGDMWDTGIVVSPQSDYMSYGGIDLDMNTNYYWKVKCWVDPVSSSTFCNTQTFETADSFAIEAIWKQNHIAYVDGILSSFYSREMGYDSSPQFVDIDNDGDYDLFVGQEDDNAGQDNSHIYYYRNDGNANNPNWILVSHNYIIPQTYMGKPNLSFVDIDNDGDYDMFIGESYAYINYYRNDGNASSPLWKLVTEEYNSIRAGNSDFVDIDNDNDYDLFSGYGSGIKYYRNDGDSIVPEWTYITDEYGAVNIAGGYTRPKFVDIDNDGDYDILAGGYSGGINYYRNDGNVFNATWTFITSNYGSIDIGTLILILWILTMIMIMICLLVNLVEL